MICFFILLGFGCTQQYCPAGLLPVPESDPSYCIMQYEAVVRDDRAYSEKGALPSSLVSFRKAAQICENTPVLDRSGRTVGHMRLASLAEWQDAGDGVVGPGGTLYPWGEKPDSSRCVLQGRKVYEQHLPSGSMTQCCSVFGVCDQIGNLWEWVDGGSLISIEAWFQARERDGLSVEVSNDRFVYSKSVWNRFFLISSNFEGGRLVEMLTDSLRFKPSVL